jgi:DNA-binding response OmpR family regulator
MRPATGNDTADSVPPIVLLVDDDRDTLEMYQTYLESSGFCVSTCMLPVEAIHAVDDLHPDIVVTDIGFAGHADGGVIVLTLKNNEGTRNIPIIVLSGRDREALPRNVLATADLCLVKPVLPDALLEQVEILLEKSRELRSRGTAARDKAATLRTKSQSLIGRSQKLARGATSASCPECHEALDWIETARLNGVDHDYFRECAKGCGLYSYNRASDTWIKLG